jgi:polysaccharide deacetylase 2 family uncharacterized protein YibQ
MAFSPAALLDRFRREKVKDPFGGDDLFDGESRFAGQGPKIALIASAVMFLILIGGVTAIVMTGDKNVAPPVMGSLADLEIVDDTAAPAAEGAPAGPPVVADSTAATDRSASRRPWLAGNAPEAAAPRLGVDASKPAAPAAKPTVTPPPAPAKIAAAPKAVEAKPDVKAPDATAPATKPVDVKAAETKASEAKAPQAKVADAKVAETKVPETKAADAKAPDAKAPPAKPADTQLAAIMAPPAATTPTMFSEPPEEALDPAKDLAGIPALQASGTAPGAPRRFDLPSGTDVGPTVAGGRPRLVEPPLPPTDKIAVTAPPPRYANLTDVKRDAGTTAPAPNAIKIAFIVDGLGLSQTATEAAINKLPPAVTLAFSPYARDLKKWIERAKEKGHEVLIEVPMESKQFPAEDPGPLGLLTSVEVKENQDRLDTIVKEANGAVGVLDVMGSKYRESSEHINLVFTKLKQSNLFYVQGTPGMRTGEASVPTAIADVVIDERPFRAAVDARLDYVERLARYQGSAVASMSAKPVSFERLALWLDQAQKKGVTLSPISQVLIKQ